MRGLLTPFVRAETYRRLAFMVSALPLGIAGFVVLVAGWSVTIVLAITPLVVPLLVALRFMVGALAWTEGALARWSLGVAVEPLLSSGGEGFWRRAGRVLGDTTFWKQQAYLLLRCAVAAPLAVLEVSLIAMGAYSIGLPIYYRWVDDADFFGAHLDTLPESLLAVPAGLVMLVAAVHLLRPLAAMWRAIASELLARESVPAMRSPAEQHALRRRTLVIFATAVGALSVLLIVIWALTSRGYFWPIHAILPLALPLGIVASIFYVLDHPELERRALGSRALTMQLGISAAIWLYLFAVWAATDRGYFWPAWVLLGLAVAAAVHAGVLAYRHSHHRIEELETSRAGAVDVQETELRRIERDLHDGAQARLVALGMSLGMAEEKLASDPEGARLLLGEARAGAREALEELRDLARGIHPPILTDRGLEAAIAALAAHNAVPVTLDVDVDVRPAPAVETAAYFVVAEALANATKHGDASQIEIRIRRANGLLVAEVVDDGRGGADPAGSGLTGLRRRVGALDGSLSVSSPEGGPTRVRAELPCV